MKTLLLASALIVAATPALAFSPGPNLCRGIPCTFVPGAGVFLARPAFVPPLSYYGPPLLPPVVFAPPPWPIQPDEGTRWAQNALNMLGFGPLNVDGIMGPTTANAVMWFQSVNGLVVDGIVGSGTTAVLNDQLRRLPPPRTELK